MNQFVSILSNYESRVYLYLFLFLFFFICPNLFGQSETFHRVLSEGREDHIVVLEDSNSLEYIFNEARYAAGIKHPLTSSKLDTGDSSDDILIDLINAEYQLKGPDKNGSAAYLLYLRALDKSLALDDTILICETLKRILNFYVFTIKDKDSFNEYLAMHKRYAYDRIEQIYNAYFDLRASHQYATSEGRKIKIPEDKWKSLIKECSNSGYHRLETELRSIQGVYLEVHERDIDGAKEAYESSIISAKNLDSTTYQRIQFAANANIGAMYHSIQKPHLSLTYLKKALDLKLSQQKPENQVYIYNWMANVYRDIGQQDSAFHYLERAYDTNQKYELNKHNIAVEEIQEKYQNETLKVDLMNTQIEKGRYYLLMWLMGGLLALGTFVYLLYSRISRLTKINLEQRIDNVEQESQLRAINAKFDGEEAERRRVANVLHDNISTHLAASRLHLGVFKKRNNSTDESIQKTDALLSEISTKVRELSHELYPPALYKLGLLESLKGLVEKYNSNSLEFSVDGDLDQTEISQEQNVKLYYIIHELIHNVIKHSRASNCSISLQHNDHELTIEVKDNGIGGINLIDQKNTGLGLYSVKARIESMPGQVTIKSPINNGTRIYIRVPVN